MGSSKALKFRYVSLYVCPTGLLDIDTYLMMVRIPGIKIQKLKSHLEKLLSVKKIRVIVLESMLGLLAFCAKGIPSIRAFIRRFYALLATLKQRKSYYLIRVTSDVKEDTLVILEFLDNFNGEYYIPERFWTSNNVLELFTDAAGNPDLGCAAYF
jgi:hypothetical protein